MQAETKAVLIDFTDKIEVGIDPFMHISQTVSIDEFLGYTNLINRIVRGYANTTDRMRNSIDLCSKAGEGTGISPEAIEAISAQMTMSKHMDSIITQLKDVQS